jgi:hypothetical protein
VGPDHLGHLLGDLGSVDGHEVIDSLHDLMFSGRHVG